MGGRGSRPLLDVLFRNRPVPRKQLFVERLWARLRDCGRVVTMFLSAVTCKWGWRRRQGLRRRREEGVGTVRGRGRAPAGKAAATTLQGFRTTASGMLRGAAPCGAGCVWGSAALVLGPVGSETVVVECGQQ